MNKYFQTQHNRHFQLFGHIFWHCDILFQWYNILLQFIISFIFTHTLNHDTTQLCKLLGCALWWYAVTHILKDTHYLHDILWCFVQMFSSDKKLDWFAKVVIISKKNAWILTDDWFIVFVNFCFRCTFSHVNQIKSCFPHILANKNYWSCAQFFQQLFSFSSIYIYRFTGDVTVTAETT